MSKCFMSTNMCNPNHTKKRPCFALINMLTLSSNCLSLILSHNTLYLSSYLSLFSSALSMFAQVCWWSHFVFGFVFVCARVCVTPYSIRDLIVYYTCCYRCLSSRYVILMICIMICVLTFTQYSQSLALVIDLFCSYYVFVLTVETNRLNRSIIGYKYK